jgi:Fur family ferric uptake transcriptional regulator
MDYQLRDLLQQHGQRNTPGRQAIFALLKAESPLAIAELRDKQSGDFDTASLYRTLNLFRKLGVIQDVVIAGQRKVELTDQFTPHHHHLACSRCGKTVTLHEELLEKYLTNLAIKHGFRHENHSFEITGVCRDCQQAT